MKIQRYQVENIVKDSHISNDFCIDAIMNLIYKDDKDRDEQFPLFKQYRELVKWVGIQIEEQGVNTVHGLVDSYQPFIPPKPSLSEKLEELVIAYRANVWPVNVGMPDTAIRELAEEARQLEAKLKEMDCE